MNKKTALLPRLRFPEFVSTGEWQAYKLGEIADRLTEKVGDKQLTTLSISAGVGFVSQAEKFSRDISGKQYENYILLKKGDFSYNKGNSKKFSQGCIYELKEYDEAASPNAFISFRFNTNYVSDFYKGYFENNFHGKQLMKFITSGARMDGLLNINPSDFFSIILPTPKDKAEQQKVADCLSSLDDLIAAESKKLEALKTHKKGLMQKLFPAEGVVAPEIRLKGFANAWEQRKLGEVADISSGGTPSRDICSYWNGDIPWATTAEVNYSLILETAEHISTSGLSNSSAKIMPVGTILMAMYGQGKTRGQVAILGIEAATNQANANIVVNQGINNAFVYYQLVKNYKSIRLSANEGGQANLSLGIVKDLPIAFTKSIREQTAIGNLFLNLDVLITAQSEKIEALRLHKKGLMQGLFPSIEGVGE